MIAALGIPMAKRRGRPKSDRDDVSVKVERALISKAKLIAAHQGITTAELVSELLREPIDRAYVKMLRELESGSQGS
jgi:hypothetical protein